MALIVQKLRREKKLSKSVFGYFKAKKSSDDHWLEGGGGGHSSLATSGGTFFYGFPNYIIFTRTSIVIYHTVKVL